MSEASEVNGQRWAKFMQLSVALEPELKERVASLAAKLGVSQSEFGRTVIERALNGEAVEDTVPQLEVTQSPEQTRRQVSDFRYAVPESEGIGELIRWIMTTAALADVDVLQVCLDIRRREVQ